MRVKELTIQYRPHPSGAHADRRKLTTPKDCASVLVPILENQAQEVFIILLLNQRNHLIAVHEVSRGGLATCQVDPRIVFRAALLVDAAAIVLAHNHPSGDPTPSADDLSLTQRLKAGGLLLGITVLDHLVIGDQQYCSFQETGRI